MRRGSTRYDKDLNVSVSTEDDSSPSSELDLLNPRVAQSRRKSRFSRFTSVDEGRETPNLLKSSHVHLSRSTGSVVNNRCVEAKLPSERNNKITSVQRASNLQRLSNPNYLRKYEPQVTFAERRHIRDDNYDNDDGHDSNNNSDNDSDSYCDSDNDNDNDNDDDNDDDEEGLGDRSGTKLRKEKSTPRIVRAIRRNSKKFDPEEDPQRPSTTTELPRPDNGSKSSVVVLYHDRNYNVEPSSSTKLHLRSSKSDQTVVRTSLHLTANEVARESSAIRARPAESPETVSPRYPIRRRRTGLRRYRRASKRPEPLNVNIYHESRVVQVTSPTRNHWTVAEGLEPGYRRVGYLIEAANKIPVEETLEGGPSYKVRERRKIPEKCPKSDKALQERCLSSDSAYSKLMANSVNANGKESIADQRKQSILCPDLSFLMQHVQARTAETGDDIHRAYVNANDIDETKRVFPFQPTPSGNLKVIPNQVVFESKKVSVLVADPRHTKVNVKAELSKPGIEIDRSFSELSGRPDLVDLPPGVTPSAINQLQTQKILPNITSEYQPRTKPYRTKIHQDEMEYKQPLELPTEQPLLMNDVPLSSLGFTDEQPIDWDNIILPEKTDLYRELARRITNYKNADCIVRIDHDEFHCHLLVLQSYSTFFDEKNCKDIDLTESSVTSKAFSIIYDWMISSTSESCHLLRRENILEIFTAAQYLGIKELEEQCWAFIDNDELFTEDSAFLLYLEAKKIGNTAVMELMVPRIMKFFLMLVSTKDFLELAVDELCLLLKSNYICVNSEMEVLMSAVRWLMHDWKERKQHMMVVLRCVRFGLIAPWQLVDVKRNPENPEFMELMSYPEVQKMVDDGLAFVIIKYWYGNQTEDYYHWIDLLGLTEPTNRNWAGEDKNYVTYREFLFYLEEYQKTNLTELKNRRTPSKPTPPSSPPKDCESFPLTRTQLTNIAQSSAMRGTKFVNTKITPTCYLAAGASTGLKIPSEMLNGYVGNLERNKGNNEAQNEERIFDARYYGGGEFPRRASNLTRSAKCPHGTCRNETTTGRGDKYDNARRHERNSSSACRCRHCEAKATSSSAKQAKSNDPGDRSDSIKSEEEAATTIQAIYRGYKARRRFDKIRKSSSEEKQNVRRVAELLSVPVGHNLHKPLEPVKVSDSMAHQGKSDEAGGQQQRDTSPRKKRRDSWWPSFRNVHQRQIEERFNARVDLEDGPLLEATSPEKAQRRTQGHADAFPLKNLATATDAVKPIKTIKSPAFFHNCDGRTNSLSPSDNTDVDDPFSPRLARNDVNFAKNNEINCQNGDEIQRAAPAFREAQSRLTNYKRPLPQRMSSSVLGPNVDNYFHDNSLFYADRESVLVFGGVDPHEEYGRIGNTGKDMYRFKPDENVWEFVGEIPEPRHHHSVAYLKGRVYLVGGADPREDNHRRKSMVVGTVWSYDPTTRIWFNETEMLTPRKNFGLIVSHGKMYAIGGQDKNGIALKTVEAFDPTDCTWKEMQPMYTARVGPASVKYRDLIWVAGGMTKSKKELFSKDIECYDPIKNLWLKGEPLKSPRCFATLYVVSDCLYVIGGASTTENSTESIDRIDVWDSYQRVWKEHTNMSIGRHGHCTGSIGAQLLIIGGVTTVFMKTLDSVECFCCERGKWIKDVSSLPHAISGHGVVSLPPANLLVDP